MKKNCVQCQKEFETNYPIKKLCGKDCKRQYYNNWMREYRPKYINSQNDDREFIYHGYKEPLIPLGKEYFGFGGVVLEDKVTGQIQCNICGRWFRHVGNHLQSHKDVIKGTHTGPQALAKKYKDMFGILRGTPIISNEMREHLVKRAMTFPWERMQKQGKKLAAMAKERGLVPRVSNKGALEKKNQEGLCYMQLLDTITKLAIKLGRTPRAEELVGIHGQNIRQTIVHTFGSVADAFKIVGIDINKMGGMNKLSELSNTFLIECLRNFTKHHKRRPTRSDAGAGLIPAIHLYEKRFRSFNKAKEIAFAN